VLGHTVLRGKRNPLLIELPPYRLPSPRTVALVLRQKATVFLRTAGTVIVVVSLILWALFSLPAKVPYSRNYPEAIRVARRAGDDDTARQLAAQQHAEKLRESYAGRLGRFIEPAIAPLGFDWKIGIGLIGSFAAREIFVSTMGLVYGIEHGKGDNTSLRRALREERRPDGKLAYTPLSGLSLLVFFMLAMQCMSTLAVVRQESRSTGWTLFMLGYLTTLAYVASLGTYQIGRLLGFG
jgi:ferrous iron transport protein B